MIRRKVLTVKPLLMAALVLALSVCAVPQNKNTTQGTVSLSVPHIATSAGERIVSFEIEVTAGAVQAISNVPVGWYVVVDNDPSWRTTVKGNIRVGAAALSPDEFRKLRVVVTKDDTDLKFAVSGAVSVTKDFEKERLVRLMMSNFAVNSAN